MTDTGSRVLFTADRLFCPGPTPVPHAVHAAGEATVYHRHEDFYRIFRDCAQRLKGFFGSANTPVILTSSGSGAMEAAMQNLTAAGDPVVVVNGGKFGERWQKLAETYQCRTEVVEIPWGQAAQADLILNAVRKQGNTRAVFLQASETSTGVYNDVAAIARELRREYQGLIVVDAISSLGAHSMKMDEWQIDCVVAGSQKGFGMAPGLAFVAMSDRAWSSLSARPRFYFDLARERKGQQPEGRSAWTPAISLILSLHAALQQIDAAGGPDGFAAHHEALALATRAAVKAAGLTLFTDSPSQAVTAINVPAGVDGSRLIKRLRNRYGMYFAGGQDQLKGKVVRFAHLGFVSRFDVIDGFAALEFALHDEGWAGTPGTGTAALVAALAQGARNT